MNFISATMMKRNQILKTTCGIAVIVFLCVYGFSMDGLVPEQRSMHQAKTGLITPVTLETGFGRWKMEQERRKNILRRFCEKTQRTKDQHFLKNNRNRLSHLIVDDNHRAILCKIPKAGSTNWRKVFVVLNGYGSETKAENVENPYYYNSKLTLINRGLQIEELVYKIENYTTVIAVRNPLERLVSVFHVIRKETGYLNKDFLNWVKIQRSNTTSYDLTFPMFVDYIIGTYGNPHWNQHWQPYKSLCHPCDIDYDIIVKTDSLEEDSDWFLKLIGAPEDLHYPYRKLFATADLTQSELKNLTSEHIAGILKYFGDDFDLFGYEKPVLQDN